MKPRREMPVEQKLKGDRPLQLRQQQQLSKSQHRWNATPRRWLLTPNQKESSSIMANFCNSPNLQTNPELEFPYLQMLGHGVAEQQAMKIAIAFHSGSKIPTTGIASADRFLSYLEDHSARGSWLKGG